MYVARITQDCQSVQFTTSLQKTYQHNTSDTVNYVHETTKLSKKHNLIFRVAI